MSVFNVAVVIVVTHTSGGRLPGFPSKERNESLVNGQGKPVQHSSSTSRIGGIRLLVDLYWLTWLAM